MPIATQPKIVWDVGFTKTLTIGFFDNQRSWPVDAPGTERVNVLTVMDAWTTGTHQLLAGTVRWIPTASETVPRVNTGWDAANGWAAFLFWARNGNAFRWFADKDGAGFVTSFLVQPIEQAEPQLESNGTRRLELVIRSTDGTAYAGY